MKKILRSIILTTLCICTLCMLGSCGSNPKAKDLPALRELSWEGKELTVTVGTNKDTGCEWKTEFEDDSIIGYSINRKFHLMSETGAVAGYSEIGYEGKKAGTAKIYLSTPCGWDGTGEGMKYTVTVTVNEDGTIESASGE